MRHRITLAAPIAAVLAILSATASSASATLPFMAHPYGARTRRGSSASASSIWATRRTR
jgi:hypothetical protein